MYKKQTLNVYVFSVIYLIDPDQHILQYVPMDIVILLLAEIKIIYLLNILNLCHVLILMVFDPFFYFHCLVVT